MSKSILVIFILAIAPSVMAQSAFQTIGPGSCGVGKNNCHSTEDPKMIDKHKNAIDNMMGSDNLATYTEKAGVDLKGVLIGKNICMSCHGTVLSGKETKEVEEGVTCEACHGAGSGYKGTHGERLPTEKKGDPNRSGYTQSLSLGLINLKNIATRAEACVRCHYITDQRVLASGHPDGSKFNYLAGMKSVAKHWTTHTITDTDLNKDSFSAAKKSKGTTGQVMAVKNVPAPQPPPTPPKAPTPTPAVPPMPQAMPPAVPLPLPATPLPAKVMTAPPPPVISKAILKASVPVQPMVTVISPLPSPTATIDLPPFPETEGKELSEILVILKKRIELLYEKTK
jgi:hypothetical protein